MEVVPIMAPSTKRSLSPRVIAVLVMTALAVGYAAWFSVRAARVEHDQVSDVAAARLGCPRERIEVGGDRGERDTVDEYEVAGCGARGLVRCLAHRQGLIAAYVRAEFDCAFYAALPGGGYERMGQLPAH